MDTSRWMLRIQAQIWRRLMSVGMALHKLADPRPPDPSFRRQIPSTISPRPGTIDLLFYMPADYQQQQLEQQQRDGADHNRGLPVVVNFHGGGFTIGQASDDARWADAVVRHIGAVVVCVEYRLAPEYPFPTAVEDGVDAILYIESHAHELGIDNDRIAISGFSSGGNMAFTVPLRLQYELERRREQGGGHEVMGVAIAAIVAWYPSTDFETNTRSERRLTNLRLDLEMPRFFTTLFNNAYLYPVPSVPLSSPYLSPGVAPATILRALPDDIIMYTCEWDELLVEAERFCRRLQQEAGKSVFYRKVLGVAHAWDKTPNPLSWDPIAAEAYEGACAALRQVLRR